MPGHINKVLTFVPKHPICSVTHCKGTLDILPFIDYLIGLGEIMQEEHLIATAIGQTIEGHCESGVGY